MYPVFVHVWTTVCFLCSSKQYFQENGDYNVNSNDNEDLFDLIIIMIMNMACV